MNQQKNTRLIRFLMAVVIGAIAGLGVGLYLRVAYKQDKAGGFWNAFSNGQTTVESTLLSAAWDYVHLLQEGNWDEAIDRILWMEERLRYAQALTGGSTAESDARHELRMQISNRDVDGNRLTMEGVEDQYIFLPDADVTYIGSDAGAEDLEAPVMERVWFEVTYAARTRALLAEDALPIHRLRVGVNLSADGKILKAGIVGNLEIDWDSISNDWS